MDSAACYNLIFSIFTLSASCFHCSLYPGWDIGLHQAGKIQPNIFVRTESQTPATRSPRCETSSFPARAAYCTWKEEFIDLRFVQALDPRLHVQACMMTICGTHHGGWTSRGYVSECWWVKMPAVQRWCEAPICPPDSALLQTARAPLLWLMELEQSRENRTPHSAPCLGSSVGQW